MRPHKTGLSGFCGAIPAEGPDASSGVPWIDRKVRELRGAREFLAGIGMAPQEAKGLSDFYRGGGAWRVPHWSGTFTDEQLIAMAKERGFRP